VKQEQEPPSADVVEVAPGILRLQLAIQMPGLGHVNCYVLEDGEGFTVVDPGMPGPTPWADLVQRFAAAGIPLARVHTVVVTHSHPDHFGGAARLRRESGADIVTHQRFRLWWDPEPDTEDPEEMTPAPLAAAGPYRGPTPWGGAPFQPPAARTSEEMRTELASGRWTPRPTRRLADADTIRLARREWVAVHTPGHTPDHLCLFDPVEGVVLSGDHVLPTITPHISGIATIDDPLAEFFASLDRMDALNDVTVALPAHGQPFQDLSGRVAAIKKHHEGRLATLRTASVELGAAAPVYEFMQHLFSPRAWGSMAESETYAHLEHLRLAGQADARWENGLLCYEVTG
jgi:glyoxylase-like metal-dependent hydrolase (beta-lactamase superfamily II)